VVGALSELTTLWSQKESAAVGYLRYRRANIPWVFFPAAWKLKAAKKQSNQKILEQVNVVLQKLGELYPPKVRGF